MIELIYILFSVLILCLLIFVPINKFFFERGKIFQINVFDYTTLNVLLFSNIKNITDVILNKINKRFTGL